jgi:hypothetical protein
MKSYDEIVGKLITSAIDMERYVVESGEPLYVRDGVREILRRIKKLDEYMAYGTDSELFKEMVEVEILTKL